MADSNLPKPLRSHDYIATDGRLIERPAVPRYPSNQRLRNYIRRTEHLAEKRAGEQEPVKTVSAAEIRARQNGELLRKPPASVKPPTPEVRMVVGAAPILPEPTPAPQPKRGASIMTLAEMLDCVTMLRAWNEHHRAIPHLDGPARAFAPLTPNMAHWLITERVSNGDGSFEKSAWHLIRQKDDLTEQLNYREKLILAGKVPS